MDSLPWRPPPGPAPHLTQAWGTVELLRGPHRLLPTPSLSHASCFAPPSRKKVAGLPVPTLTLHASQRESAHYTAGKHLCHLPQGPLRGQNLSGCPAIHPKDQLDLHVHHHPPSPGPSPVNTLPRKAHLLLLCHQFCLELSLHSKARGPGPEILPSQLRAQLSPLVRSNPSPQDTEEVHARPTKEVMGLALKG